ncbi:MAG TPA: ABC transporter substrate-binding protein [Firmicutes bacterium]|nr:ABC transporter substrate-binding protein [Bacillota bacterium]
MKRSMLTLIVLTLVLSLASTAVLAQSGRVAIWSAASEEEAQALAEEFRTLYPNIIVDIIRAGSGELITRLMAESPRPSGDILLGIAKESLDAVYDSLVPYKAKNHDEIPATVRDNAEIPAYYGFSMPLQAFMINTDLLKPEDYPLSWDDLTDEKYRGEIILANPALSGSAYAQLYMMYDLYGFDFAVDVAKNAVFTASSTMVPESVARGEYAIGITGESNIAQHITDGSPVIAIYPEEGTGARFDGSAILKGGPNTENAKLFMDYLTSEQAYRTIYETRSRRVVHPAIPGPGPLPGLDEIVLREYDANEAAEIREDLTMRFSDKVF